MKTYPKLSYPEDSATNGLFETGHIVAQEKLDGMNFRFSNATDDGDIRFGSRRIEFVDDVNNKFKPYVEYARNTIDMDTLREMQPITVFAEAMEPHTISEYDFDSIPAVIGFDVWSHTENEFISTDKSIEMMHDIELETAHVHDTSDVEAWKNNNTSLHTDGELLVPESMYGDIKAEGLVLKNPQTNTRAKTVRETFKERNKEIFGDVSADDPDAIKLSNKYITNQRIRKAAHRLVDEGEWDELQMEMMQDLPEAVIRDMAVEEAGTILMSENYGELDVHEFRSHVSSRCSNVLRKMIAQNLSISNS